MSKNKNRKRRSVLAALLLVASIFFGTVWNPDCAQAATGKGDYYIKINKGTNVVTVYKQDGTPYTAFTCSIGYSTPTGTFYTPAKYRWWTLDGPSYGQYCTRITGGFLFHSVWYYSQTKNSQSYVQYNKLGTTASHGCCRLTVAAAKWIYDNCPLGTKVIIFNGTAKNDPLGKPQTIQVKVSGSRTMGWDPTDPDKDNPYETRSTKPVIKVSKKVLDCGSEFGDGNMTCKDSGGFDITDWVKMTGTVDTKTIGTYPVTYSVIDSFGRTAELNVTYKVVDKKAATLTGVRTTLAKPYGSTRDMRAGLKAKNASGDDLTSKIHVYIKAPGRKEYKEYKRREYTFTKEGVYQVKYTVTNPNSGKTTTVKQEITVIDNESPVLASTDEWSAITDVKAGSEMYWSDLMKGVKASLQSGRSIADTVKITITTPAGKTKTLKKDQSYVFSNAGEYMLTYTVVNPDASKSKRTVTQTRTLTVLEEQKPEEPVDENQPGDTTDGTQTENDTEQTPADDSANGTQTGDNAGQTSSDDSANGTQTGDNEGQTPVGDSTNGTQTSNTTGE